MARSTVHYDADSETNNILKKLHNKLRPAGTPVQRVEYIIELLMLRIFEVKIQQDPEFAQLREMFRPDPKAVEEKDRERDKLLLSSLIALPNDSILPQLNQRTFPFYSRILGEARKVWKGNLSTKVQDQLVLIEEIFGNSNFTNNVTSGNMAEIIGLVADLDKDRLLKTDLLGDAIESALSETGGTKDIGLHRTPDHIRQFMVALIAPTFSDLLFDPTVGTGGFMFDSFEYVLQGVSRDGHWPGPKAHPELAAWFKTWFDAHPENAHARKSPPTSTATASAASNISAWCARWRRSISTCAASTPATSSRATRSRNSAARSCPRARRASSPIRPLAPSATRRPTRMSGKSTRRKARRPSFS